MITPMKAIGVKSMNIVRNTGNLGQMLMIFWG